MNESDGCNCDMADMRSWEGGLEQWEQFFGRQMALLPTRTPTRTPGLEKEGGSQPASQPAIQPYSHTAIQPYGTAAKQRRPSLPSLHSQSSVMWLARLPPLSSEHPPAWASLPPMGVILPRCRKTTEQLPCDIDHWLRDCAAWRITRGSRCGLVHSPFYPGPGLGVSISQRGVL
jgi:hypothetical protein